MARKYSLRLGFEGGIVAFIRYAHLRVWTLGLRGGIFLHWVNESYRPVSPTFVQTKEHIQKKTAN